MKCDSCGKFVTPKNNKGNDTTPICPYCDNSKVIQNVNINGSQNVVNQHQGNVYNVGNIEECYFCSNEAVTHCIDCLKPLCKSHTYTILSKDRCSGCNTVRIGRAGVNGVITTVKELNKFMKWGSSLICP